MKMTNYNFSNLFKRLFAVLIVMVALGVNLQASGTKENITPLDVEFFSTTAQAQLQEGIPGILWFMSSMCNCPWGAYAGCSCFFY